MASACACCNSHAVSNDKLAKKALIDDSNISAISHTSILAKLPVAAPV